MTMIKVVRSAQGTKKLVCSCLFFVAGSSLPAFAQNDKMTPIATPAEQNAIALGAPVLPSSVPKESWYSQYGSQFARNVQRATLTSYLPDPAIANGTAVIVAPGGGFMTLSMENEGNYIPA